MGIVDKKNYTLKCSSCETNESGLVVDKGSTWSGASWSNRCNFRFFNVQWKNSDTGEPAILNATCIACGSIADVNFSYGI